MAAALISCATSSMDRVPDYESVGWEFESPVAHQLRPRSFRAVSFKGIKSEQRAIPVCDKGKETTGQNGLWSLYAYGGALVRRMAAKVTVRDSRITVGSQSGPAIYVEA